MTAFAALPDVIAETAALSERFASAGAELGLVGGIVRDLALGSPLDPSGALDFATDVTPPTIRRLVGPIADAIWNQGERFGTIGCQIAGRHCEITTYREEAYVSDSRKPVVRFSDRIDVDLSRRDFTVNAMAIWLPSGELVDPFGGLDDLAARRLRTPLAPEVSFSDDPLRMLRAARFAAAYGLVPGPEVEAAMVSVAPRLAIVSVERVTAEVDKLLSVARCRPGLALLEQAGLLTAVVPTAGGALLDAVDLVAPDPVARLAVLLADTDPADRRRWTVTSRQGGHRAHALLAVSAGADDVRQGTLVTDADLRHWARGVGPYRARALAVADAVAPGDPLVRAVAERAHALRDDLDAVVEEPLPIGGAEVMAWLGLAPGPAVGAVLDEVLSWRLVEGPLDPESLRTRVESHYRPT